MCESEGIRHIEIHRKTKEAEEDDERSDICQQLPHREQLLRGDSDQVSLDSLLKAVIDISDCLNQQEEKLKKHESILSKETSSKHKKRDRMFPVTAVRKYANQSSYSSDSDLDQSQTVSELSSKLSVGTSRSKRSGRLTHSPIKPDESRKNISFSNDSVREIDMENQRLLKEILNTKPKTLTQRKGKLVRPLSASAVNRQRQQKEIERENLRLLNRLQSVQATKTLSRDKLLSEHGKNMEHSSRISKGTRSRPSSARTTCSMDSRSSYMDIFDNESILSSATSIPSVRSMRSVSSKSSRASSAKGSRPSSGKKKVTRCNVWEPGW